MDLMTPPWSSWRWLHPHRADRHSKARERVGPAGALVRQLGIEIDTILLDEHVLPGGHLAAEVRLQGG